MRTDRRVSLHATRWLGPSNIFTKYLPAPEPAAGHGNRIQKAVNFVSKFCLPLISSSSFFFRLLCLRTIVDTETNLHHIYFRPICYGHCWRDCASCGLHTNKILDSSLVSHRSAQFEPDDRDRLSLNASRKIRIFIPRTSLPRQQLLKWKPINRSKSRNWSRCISWRHLDPFGNWLPHRPPPKAPQKRPACLARHLELG